MLQFVKQDVKRLNKYMNQRKFLRITLHIVIKLQLQNILFLLQNSSSKNVVLLFLRDLANNLSGDALLTEMQYLSIRPGVVCLAVLLASSKYFLDKVRGQGFGGRGFGPGREYFNPLKSVLYYL